MTGINGVHHAAICTRDIKRHVAFFVEVLGGELVAIYWMHHVKNTCHAFVRFDDHNYVAFVTSPAMHEHPDPGPPRLGAPTPPGILQHLALNVASMDALLALRDRARSRGVFTIGPVDQGFCHSLYLPAPEGMTIELTYAAGPIPSGPWIDPEVVAFAGITDDELARWTHSAAPLTRSSPPVASPPWDEAHPQWLLPPPLAFITTAGDDEIAERMADTQPPVALAER